ncbi:MAG: methyltransferase domain-containing protein [Allorhizobium sp.]
MSGFDQDWLTLREPADRAARVMAQVETLADYLAARANARLVDIGCGTGSTWRTLSGALPAHTSWLLLDYDRLLLDEAERRIGRGERVEFRQADLSDIGQLPLEGISVVTASAFFDLCSEKFCAALVALIADRGCGLYAALNYDGNITWSIPHPLDGAVVSDFNSHQRTDKGFGPALGPDATDCLAGQLAEHAFRLHIEDSPWRMDSHSAALQTAFLEGFRAPLAQIGSLSQAQIDAWLAFRLSAVNDPQSLCEVGHKDLLALPA